MATAKVAKKPAHKPSSKASSKSKTTSTKKSSAAKKTTKSKKTTAVEQPDAVEKITKKRSEPAATLPKPIDELSVSNIFPIESLSNLKPDQVYGEVFRLDDGFLDSLRLVARRIDDGGKAGFEIEMKISGPSRKDFEERLEKKGAKKAAFAFRAGEPKKKKDGVHKKLTKGDQSLSSSYGSYREPSTSASGHQALVLKGTNYTLEYLPNDSLLALRGMVRIRLNGSDAQCQKALKTVIEKAGLQPAFAPPTPISVKRYALMRLLSAVSPAKAKELSDKGPLSKLKISQIETALKSAKVSKKRMDGLRFEQVAPGHFTVFDPDQLAKAKKAGLLYAYSTTATKEHVLAILQGGQKATLTRWSEGLLFSGMSSLADVGSGGAEGVFSRIVLKKHDKATWTGRTYKIILKPEILGRLDVWGWPSDHYGQGWDLTAKNFGAPLVKSISEASSSGYSSYNEIISPVGNGPQLIAAIVATSQPQKDDLIEFLKKAKYEPPNGETLDDFVRLSPNIDVKLL